MSTMNFALETVSDGATGHHRTRFAEFWSVEQRLGGALDKPNPLELLLGSLTGCMNVILQMVASEKGWAAVSASYQATGELDPRGLMGNPEVPPYFQRVSLGVRLIGVPQAELEFVQREVGRRCPVHRLLEKAGIDIHESWDVA